MGEGYDYRLVDHTFWLGVYYNVHPYAMEAQRPVIPPDTALLFVRKQIHQEALQAGWEGVKRCFINHPMFTTVSDSQVGVALRLNILGRIELGFVSKGWIKFLVIDWISTIAFVHIKHIDDIRLTGYITHPQEAKWIHILQQRNSFDYKSATNAIFIIPASQM
ncbi:hypothetical protein SLS61_007859 [Didymella pomorum]